VGGLQVVRRRNAGFGFEPSAVAPRQGPNGRDLPACDEDRTHEPGLRRRNQHAAPQLPQPLEALE
jgi:hypothetical protein